MNKKRGRRRKKKAKTDLEDVMADFVACGRCSFFLSGYRVLHGMEELVQAVDASDDQWLTLKWDHETRRLVQASYGSRLDIDFYYYDGRCPECQRRFVIGAGAQLGDTMGEEAWVEQEDGEEQEDPEPSTLRVALTSP